MSLDVRITKLRARSERLLDLQIGLEEKYAMLRPLAFDGGLAKRVGKGPPARGHLILKNALLQSCVADIVKLSLDRGPRTPSAYNIMEVLHARDVLDRLRTDYAVVPHFTQVGDGDPLPPKILDRWKAQERDRLIADFDNSWSELHQAWGDLERSSRLGGFKTWRDKLIAHTELRHKDGQYQVIDLSSLGLKWGDAGDVIAELRQIVTGINIVTRGASFDWEMLAEQLEAARTGFWAMLGRESPGGGG